METKRDLKISFVVPCYNCIETIDRCVDSLINQIYSDIEIVLVDDGSTDLTPEYCDKTAKIDPRITVVHKKNGGLVSAWKAGVSVSTGEYILFCDADDYLDNDLTQKISEIINQYHPELITFGMVFEYANKNVKRSNLLPGGYYCLPEIRSEILPRFFSNGDMESEIIMNSRWSKAFLKSVLEKVMDEVPNDITRGEDAVTTFSAVLKVNSIYSCEDFYPYHYVRSNISMIGSYDEHIFEKLEKKYNTIRDIASKNDYSYESQINAAQLSSMLLYIKKEISQNPYGYFKVRRKLKTAENLVTYKNCMKFNMIKKYKLNSKLFAVMLMCKFYGGVYCLVKIKDFIDGRKLN